jgi:hypothetical protein
MDGGKSTGEHFSAANKNSQPRKQIAKVVEGAMSKLAPQAL